MLGARAGSFLLGFLGILLVALAGGQSEERLGLSGPGESLRLALLKTPQVQKELKLSEEQKQKIDSLRVLTKQAKKQVEIAHGKDQEKGKPKAVDAEGKERERMVREAMNADLAILERDTDRRLNEILDRRQRVRLTQILLRVEGPSAFVTPELIETLGLAPEQVAVIREILGEASAAQEQFKEQTKRRFELYKGSGDESVEKIRKEQQKGQERAHAYRMNQELMPRIGRVLTRGQREHYNRLIGEPFDLGGLTGPAGEPLFVTSADLSLSLVRQPAVQEELQLTEQQKQRLERGEAVEKVLKESQRQRLLEIELQADGPAALVRPEVASVLKLREDQQRRIWGVLEDLRIAGDRLRETLKDALKRQVLAPDEATKEQEKAQMRAGSERLREQAMKTIEEILSSGQLRAFQRLLGEPFDFSRMRARPRPGAAVFKAG